jgi:glycerol-3-phosphate dehydrogenase
MHRHVEALESQTYELLVLGGGITGAGVALDAALRGVRVALIDKGDFASGTSSISSKLVHGGLRYLEQRQIGLVYEALRERRRLLHNAPHLVWPLRFVIPVYAGSRIPWWQWRAGVMLYDILAGRENLQHSQSRPAHWFQQQFPALKVEALQGGVEYADAQMDDARLVIEVLRTAAQHGAVVCNYIEAMRFEGDTVHAVDHQSGRDVRLRANVIVNATGPWSDRVRQLAGEDDGPLLAPTKGVHLILADQGFANAFLFLHPTDGRVFFVIPWLGKTLIGTTDTECDTSPDTLTVTDDDISYLLRGYNHHFASSLQPTHILGQFVGVRPLARSQPNEPSARSREWRLVTGKSGMLTVVGGKYTTYRHMAEKITDAVMQRLGRQVFCATRTCRLDGTPPGGWAEYEREAVSYLSQQVSEATARHLVRRYGQRAGEVLAYVARDARLAQPVIAGEPDILAEFEYHREHEMACTRADCLLRRTRLGLFHAELMTASSPGE